MSRMVAWFNLIAMFAALSNAYYDTRPGLAWFAVALYSSGVSIQNFMRRT